MRNHFQLQNYYFSTKFCAFNCIIFNAKRNQRGRRFPRECSCPRGCSCLNCTNKEVCVLKISVQLRQLRIK